MSTAIIGTPPIDRLAIRTYVSEFDAVTIREALLREHYRGGQSFYVVPRISDLPEIEEFLKDQLPELTYVVAHGQMAAGELDDRMNAFYDGKYDVLLATTIVESGLDIPTANTMVVHRADMFESHQVSREKLSTRERMANVLDKLKGRDFVPFVELFNPEEGRLGVVVTFLATLELVKGSLIELVQNGPFAPIHVKAKTLVLEESDVLAQLELEDEPDDGVDDETDAHDGTEG